MCEGVEFKCGIMTHSLATRSATGSHPLPESSDSSIASSKTMTRLLASEPPSGLWDLFLSSVERGSSKNLSGDEGVQVWEASKKELPTKPEEASKGDWRGMV